MFSPQLNGNAAANSTRSSRRRQRPHSNEGSIAQPKAKRQRSALSDHTFIAPNGEVAPEMEETKGKIASVVRQESAKDNAVHAPKREIVVRGKKAKTGERTNRGDGSVVLTTNDTYTVSKLPALPDRLRTDITARQHGAIYSDTGYALTLTHSHAMVWPYATSIPSPETFTFALPHPSKHTSDALPLGSLVSASASSPEPGLVVVMPTGIITYWESIATAATLDLIRQQRNGVEYNIPSMLHGETAVQVLNAESAGFVIGFSTGRLAYMSVRDREGRPAISVQFLRGASGSGAGGLFGSLRHALTMSAWRGDIAAVRAGRSDKIGERNVVVATEKGKLQAWNLHRDGHNSLRADADGREAIVLAIKHANPALSDLLLESFEVLDFTFTPKSITDSQLKDQGLEDDDKGVHLLLLTSLTDGDAAHYSLVEVVLTPEEMLIGTIRTIRSYSTPKSRIAACKPRLYLPKPALVAFVVFDRAVIVTSMAKQPDSPESQLRAESHLTTRSFEDVIDFREDLNVEIVGSGMEEPQPLSHDDSKSRKYKAKYPAVVMIVRGGGVVRVAATDVSKLVTNAPQVTPKSKLEQAVFFGTLDKNPLSFVGRMEQQFSAEEAGLAALELSRDILRSDTPYIPSVPASIEQNLKKRAAALRDLALHLKSTGVMRKLDRELRWRLIWDAEKMAAAVNIWKSYDTRLKTKPEGQKRGLLTEIIEFIHEDYKTEPLPEAGELDRVRLWFIKDVWNLEVAVPWAYQVIKYTYQDGQKDHAFIMETLSEANDVVLGALGGAFDFRTANLKLYELQSEKLKHGILLDDYEDLPEFWTSTFYITDNIRKQADLAGMLLREYWQSANNSQRPDESVIEKLRLESPTLIDLGIRSNLERIRWDSVQDEPQLQIQAEELKSLQDKSQHDQLTLLAEDIDLPNEAISLAEKHAILPTLAEVLMSQIVHALTYLKMPAIDKDEQEYWQRRASDLQTQAEKEFTKFGAGWATALYEYHISIGAMSELLDKYQNQQRFLTQFLRSRPEYAKVAWINEVSKEKDFEQAADTLLDLGMKREQHLWSKKVELSLGKLARLASKKTYSQSNGLLIPDGGQADFAGIHDQLALTNIQERIYKHVLPSISSAVDESAELQLALEAHGNKSLLKMRYFASILEEAMKYLLQHHVMTPGELFDLLTLMGDNGRGDEDDSIHGEEFYLALQAAHRGIQKKDDSYIAQQIIWRRCFLRDDWSKINNTDLKNDDEVSDQLRSTALYSTLRACFKNRLFDPSTNVKPLGPKDVLTASTTDLDGRFNGLDASIREFIMKDMQVESAALKPFIDTCRLEKWHQSALELAKLDFEQELSEETIDGTMMQDAAKKLEEVEKEIKELELKNASNLLHSKPNFKARPKQNGGFRASTKLY
ncbi:hypothetical protein BP5796_02518 [Coleophoma crateriformis]|uniref:Uncharacterized protein n=1 Tax=Coleophoma crateriformis TaxID=565419 RepID=A0A3D8SYG0_9HELO|nr:hypothetical protein BP5796_02518 [Coleophoma crateriformis]